MSRVKKPASASRSSFPKQALQLFLAFVGGFLFHVWLSPQGEVQSSTRRRATAAETATAKVTLRNANVTSTGSAISSDGTSSSSSTASQSLMSFPYIENDCKPGAWNGVAFQAPTFFPIRPFEMVLGDRETPCKFIPNGQCDAFSKGELEWPEGFVIEVLIATLADCPLRKCHVLDLGGNMGYVNSFAGSLGAKVISVEPQEDLATANRATIQHNCWQHRVTNLDGMITLDAAEDNKSVTTSNLWRPGMVDFTKTRKTQKIYLGRLVEMMGSKDIALVKIDVDSIDVEILNFITRMIKAGQVNVQNFIIESPCSGISFYNLQQLGYNVFQLDHHQRARFFDARGRDVYKYRGGPIPWLDSIGEEYQCRRGMRTLLKFPAGSDVATANRHCSAFASTPVRKGFPSGVTSWLITKETLLETSVMESWSKKYVPSTMGIYKNNLFGMPGEPVNPAPECTIAQE